MLSESYDNQQHDVELNVIAVMLYFVTETWEMYLISFLFEDEDPFIIHCKYMAVGGLWTKGTKPSATLLLTGV